MSDLALVIRGLERTFRSGESELHVLQGVDLDVKKGEIVGLMGPSGSGKSSLLHAAGLLERPTRGEVVINGVSAWDMNDDDRTALRRNEIGFVYQFHHLLAEFDAQDNVALPRLIAGDKRRHARSEAERLLSMLNMQHRLHHQPPQLSGGEQQRVAIARALVNGPALLLADEPTGNLDPDTSSVVFKALYDLARQEGVGALIATHNQELAGYMDRVMVIDHGRLVQRR